MRSKLDSRLPSTESGSENMKQISAMNLIALFFLSGLAIVLGRIFLKLNYNEASIISFGFAIYGFFIIFVHVYNHKKGIIKL